MSIADFDREDVAHLVPFYVNGTANRTERELVEAGMERSDALREEVSALSALRDTWRSLPAVEGESAPGEAGLHRLLAEIGTEEDPPPVISHRIPVPANVNAPIWARALALAAAAAFGAVLSASVLHGPEEEPFAVMASGGSDVMRDVPSLTVVFQPDAPVAAVSGLLRRHGLTVVDGPSAVGLFRLAREDGGTPSFEDAEALRLREDLFELVDDPE